MGQLDVVWSLVRRGKVNSRLEAVIGGVSYQVMVPNERLRQSDKPLMAWEFSFGDDGCLVYGQPKAKRRWKPLRAVRDMGDFDPQAEWLLVRRLVGKAVPFIFGFEAVRFLDLDGLAGDIFCHFWERGFFAGFNSQICSSYEGYLSRGVRNWLIGYRRSKSYRANGVNLSLDEPLVEGEAGDVATGVDSLEDGRGLGVEGQLEWSGLASDLRRACEAADGEAFGGSPVYSEMLSGFLAGEAPRGRSRAFRERLDGFRAVVAPVFEEWGFACGV